MGTARLSLALVAALGVGGAGPSPAAAQGVEPGLEITHDPVGCLEAGRHPKVEACFSPASQVARGRVYFRAHGTPDWYYVNMVPEAECFSGTLPRPQKSIGGVDYYVEAIGHDFAESLTPVYEPVVVDDGGQCRGLLAPVVDKAKVVVASASGAVGLVPQGFAASGMAGGAISSGLLLGAVGGGAAAMGLALADGDEALDPPDTPPLVAAPPASPEPPSAPAAPDPPPASEPSPPPASEPSPPPASEPSPPPASEPSPPPASEPSPPPASEPETPPAPNQPPDAVFNVSPRSGDAPLQVTFDMCGSTDPDEDPLEYSISFGDLQGYHGPECRVTHEYTHSLTFLALVCVGDGNWGHSVCRIFTIQVGGGDDGVGGSSVAESVVAGDGPSRPVPIPGAEEAEPGATGALAVDSDLMVRGASGQIVLNGSESAFVGEGPSRVNLGGRLGLNRFEAVVGEATGPGEWRLELSSPGREIDGLVVVAGQPVQVSPRQVVFALAGRPGERLVFTFRLTALSSGPR